MNVLVLLLSVITKTWKETWSEKVDIPCTDSSDLTAVVLRLAALTAALRCQRGQLASQPALSVLAALFGDSVTDIIKGKRLV